MKIHVLFAVVALLLLFNSGANAQAPVISYNPATYIYANGTAISNVTPKNTGGTVTSANGYAYVKSITTTGLNGPQACAIDGSGNLWVANSNGNNIAIINPGATTPVVTIVAGSITNVAGAANSSPVGAAGTTATFSLPYGIAYDGVGFMYVADFTNNLIRKISTTSPYTVTTIAGTGAGAELDNASGLSAQFSGPRGIVYDSATGNLYVSDYTGNKIRIVSTASGNAVSTVPTAAGQLHSPTNIAYDGTNYYVTTYIVATWGNAVYKVTPTGTVSLFAGVPGTPAETDGTGGGASFSGPTGIVYDKLTSCLYVADLNGNTIRKITVPGAVVTTLAGSATASDVDGNGTAATFKKPWGITSNNAGTLYVAENASTYYTRKIDLTGYSISPNLTTNTGLTFNATTGVISGTPTTTSSAVTYTVTGNNTTGSSSTTLSIAVGNSYDWIGVLTTLNPTAWAVAGNWSGGVVPGQYDTANIGVSGLDLILFEPNISTTVTVGSVIFGPHLLGGLTPTVLSIASGASVTINSNLTVNAGATPAITGTGTGAVNIAPGSIVNVGAGGTLTLTSASTSFFTLQSSAAGDASIGQVTSGQITGTAATSINVQRYMRPLRGYCFLSTPVNNGAATVNSGVAKIYTINYLANSTYLSGTSFPNSPTVAPYTKVGNPSIYLFRETVTPLYTSFTNSSYRGISSIASSPAYPFNNETGTFNIPVASGFLFFFRGGVGTATPYVSYSTALAGTLTAVGTLNIGQVTFTDWFTAASTNLSYTSTSPTNTAGFNLVGNPYACAIDLETFQTNAATQTVGIYGTNDGAGHGISSTFYVFDPVTQNYGSYISGGGFNGVGSAAFVSNIISSGQGFFVKTNTTTSKLIFNESAKTTRLNTGSQLLMGTPVNTAQVQYLRLKMGQSDLVNEQTLIHFYSEAPFTYNTQFDAAHKSGNGAVSLLSRSADNVALCINSMPLPHLQSDVVRLGVQAASDGQYSLTMTDMVGIPQLYDIWLMDAYKKDSLDIRHNPTYLFDVYHSDTTSFGPNRFKLVIRQNPGYAYHLLNFTANKVPNATQVQLVWETENEANYTDFAVERSTDGGNTFTILGSMASSDQRTYSLLDKKPVIGQNLYRLKQEDINSVITYSKVISVQYYATGNLAKSGINVYPNPSTGIINLAVVEPVTLPSVFNIKIMSSSGQVVKEISSGEATWHGNVGDLSPGTYIIQVTNSKTPSFVGENKFVKL